MNILIILIISATGKSTNRGLGNMCCSFSHLDISERNLKTRSIPERRRAFSQITKRESNAYIRMFHVPIYIFLKPHISNISSLVHEWV